MTDIARELAEKIMYRVDAFRLDRLTEKQCQEEVESLLREAMEEAKAQREKEILENKYIRAMRQGIEDACYEQAAKVAENINNVDQTGLSTAVMIAAAIRRLKEGV